MRDDYGILDFESRSNDRKLIYDITNLKKEKSIDLMDVELPEMRNFILPGGHKLSSYCHIARCVCRRAERLVIESIEQNNMSSEIVVFLNRLSDFLFVLARKVLKDHGLDETPWNPKKN